MVENLPLLQQKSTEFCYRQDDGFFRLPDLYNIPHKFFYTNLLN